MGMPFAGSFTDSLGMDTLHSFMLHHRVQTDVIPVLRRSYSHYGLSIEEFDPVWFHGQMLLHEIWRGDRFVLSQEEIRSAWQEMQPVDETYCETSYVSIWSILKMLSEASEEDWEHWNQAVERKYKRDLLTKSIHTPEGHQAASELDRCMNEALVRFRDKQ